MWCYATENQNLRWSNVAQNNFFYDLIKLPRRATLIQVWALSIESLVTISERMNKFQRPPHIHFYSHFLCVFLVCQWHQQKVVSIVGDAEGVDKLLQGH
jgi:hypothetical protein